MADCYREDKRMTQAKKSLKKALFELLAEKEWEKISVRDISERAKLNRSTFYQYYQDKYDLLYQTVSNMIEALKDDIFSCESDPKEPAAYGYLLKFYRHLAEHHHEFALIVNRRYELNIKQLSNEFWNDSFLTGIKRVPALEMDRSVPIEIRKEYVISAHTGIVIWWLENDMPYSPEFMTKSIVTIIQNS